MASSKPIIAITPSCAQNSPAIGLILPDDDELLDQLCAEELIFSCGPAVAGGGCGNDAYHPAQGWEALCERLRRCGFTTTPPRSINNMSSNATGTGPTATRQPTAAEMRAFLKRRYKHNRFEGRDGTAPGWEDYSEVVVQSALRDLVAYGRGFISHHEAASGEVITYTAEDVINSANNEERAA